MTAFWYKFFGVLLIAIGEVLAIYCEVISAKYSNSPRMIGWMLFWITVAGFPLIAGYILGYKGFNSIWVVSVTSVVSILIAEPIVNYSLMGELPTPGALVGFILGAIGLICALTF